MAKTTKTETEFEGGDEEVALDELADIEDGLDPDALAEDLDEEIDEDLDDEIDEDEDLEVAELDDDSVDDDDDSDDDDDDAEALDELEAEELEMLTDDEASEVIAVDLAAEIRKLRREERSLDVDPEGAGSDEFVCTSCFLVKRTSQLADRRKRVCRDCAA